MSQPKNNTGVALISPEETAYEPWTFQFGGDGQGYIKMMSNPNRYITELNGENYTAIEPFKNLITYEDMPQTYTDYLDYANGNVQPLVESQQARVRREDQYGLHNKLSALGVSNTPIVRMSQAPVIIDVEPGSQSIYDRMSRRDVRRANRQLNRDERKLNRDVRRDSRVEQAIARKFGSDYNVENRMLIDDKFDNERERIKLMRRLVNGQ